MLLREICVLCTFKGSPLRWSRTTFNFLPLPLFWCLSLLFPQTKDIPKRPYSQSLATVISPALAEVRNRLAAHKFASVRLMIRPFVEECLVPEIDPSSLNNLTFLPPHLQLKARQEQVNGNPMVLDELREAILMAEEAFPGISDSLVAHMVHRLQR